MISSGNCEIPPTHLILHYNILQLRRNYTVQFIAPILLYWCYVIVRIWKR